MQRDSDEEVISGKTDKAKLPVQEESHFKKFNIKYRNAESKEEVKQAISFLENKALFLNLIPIAFNEDLESKTLVASLLVEKPKSIKYRLGFYLDLL